MVPGWVVALMAALAMETHRYGHTVERLGQGSYQWPMRLLRLSRYHQYRLGLFQTGSLTGQTLPDPKSRSLAGLWLYPLWLYALFLLGVMSSVSPRSLLVCKVAGCCS